MKQSSIHSKLKSGGRKVTIMIHSNMSKTAKSPKVSSAGKILQKKPANFFKIPILIKLSSGRLPKYPIIGQSRSAIPAWVY